MCDVTLRGESGDLGHMTGLALPSPQGIATVGGRCEGTGPMEHQDYEAPAIIEIEELRGLLECIGSGCRPKDVKSL